MKRYKKKVVSGIIVLMVCMILAVVIAPLFGQSLWPFKLTLSEGMESYLAFEEANQCARHQMELLEWIEAYKDKHGHFPKTLNELIEDDMRCMYCFECEYECDIEFLPDNYGLKDKPVLREINGQHPNTIELYLRACKPAPQVMGDGTGWLFEDGKIATIPPKKKK